MEKYRKSDDVIIGRKLFKFSQVTRRISFFIKMIVGDSVILYAALLKPRRVKKEIIKGIKEGIKKEIFA